MMHQDDNEEEHSSDPTSASGHGGADEEWNEEAEEQAEAPAPAGYAVPPAAAPGETRDVSLHEALGAPYNQHLVPVTVALALLCTAAAPAEGSKKAYHVGLQNPTLACTLIKANSNRSRTEEGSVFFKSLSDPKEPGWVNEKGLKYLCERYRWPVPSYERRVDVLREAKRNAFPPVRVYNHGDLPLDPGPTYREKKAAANAEKRKAAAALTKAQADAKIAREAEKARKLKAELEQAKKQLAERDARLAKLQGGRKRVAKRKRKAAPTRKRKKQPHEDEEAEAAEQGDPPSLSETESRTEREAPTLQQSTIADITAPQDTIPLDLTAQPTTRWRGISPRELANLSDRPRATNTTKNK